jgi:predicted transcriptional regulator of viral defense system
MHHEIDPHLIELIVVRSGSASVADPRSLARDVDRGVLVRVRRGVYVLHAAWDPLSPEQRHVVAMRALAAASGPPLAFSHWSAAVALGLPVLDRRRLASVHLTAVRDERRTLHGTAVHEFEIGRGELTRVGELLVTTPARTVVDVAGASPFREGVVTADGAMHRGVRRAALQEAAVLAGFRRAAVRIADVLAFAHPDAESAAESESRTSMLLLGIAPPVLQHRFFDRRGFVARSDFWDPERRIAGEADGMKKFLDPALATEGAGMAVWEEKRREDRLLGCVHRLARWGYREARSVTLLGRVLAAAGWLPAAPPATLHDYIAAARTFG